jgi:hypothetical protein
MPHVMPDSIWLSLKPMLGMISGIGFGLDVGASSNSQSGQYKNNVTNEVAHLLNTTDFIFLVQALFVEVVLGAYLSLIRANFLFAPVSALQ